jgi:hypothetical protein
MGQGDGMSRSAEIEKLRSALLEAEISFSSIRTMSFSVMNRENIRKLADDEVRRIKLILQETA